MLNIFDEQLLNIVQGNSAEIVITITDRETGSFITIGEKDNVLFTVKNARKETVIQKVLTSNDISEDDGYSLLARIEPEETMINTGDYSYDVLLVTSDGQAITFVSSNLIIQTAVGLYTDIGGGSDE